ncbi:MAG TPA: nucleotidyltransferase family protein [Gemmataceae bacterium]|nr:nucleotidyltransferase family protein [Gemmataceae bacterium]
MSRTIALIPAAGKSSRMGKPKLGLPLGDRSILECVLDAMKQAGIANRLVVVGPQAVELAELAEKAGADVLRLAEDTPDMQATVLQGLAWLETQLHPGPDDSWLLMPADHPTLNPAVVTELLKARSEHPDQTIFIPTHAGQRGHPALIAWKLVADLRRWPAGQGLNRFLREHAGQTCECPLNDPEILCDLDTPQDYQHLLERFRSQHRIP